MKISCAVVIPVYKTNLSDYESASLNRVKKILGHYPIIFVAPDQMAAAFLLGEQVQYFAPRYFKDLQAYNNLMVSPRFYKRFLHYSHILIYQLDAYVFRDELDYWSRQPFSYIGAPWIHAPFYPGQSAKYKKYGLQYPVVGNGGFSLRAVKIHYYSTLFFLTWILRRILNSVHEDWFWVNVIARINPWYHVADLETAFRFSVESQPEKSIQFLDGKLPFGCHAWDKNYLSFWQKYIPLTERGDQ